ncbi:YdcF family protein [Thiosocius teredinicola]|uniref:YdcF family protein n=1 Tax=Thiosocius teredinicola TaxID=1973002 RepID=UPI000990DB29
MDIDVGTRAILKLILLPPGGLILLMLIGWLFAKHFFGRFLIFLSIVAFYALSTPVGLNWLAAQVETVPAPSQERLNKSGAGAILVLLADVSRHNPEVPGGDKLGGLSLQRVDYALQLQRQTKLPIVLSGGSVKGDTRPLADLAADWLRAHGSVKILATENTSKDTKQNARNSAGLLKEHKIQRVILVTHASHMPRALIAAQTEGIDAMPAPFGFEHVPPTAQTSSELGDWLPHPGYLGRSYRILHEMAGLIWYGFNHH